MSRQDAGPPTQPGDPVPAERLTPLVAAQPLVLVVGAAGAGRSAALTVLAGPSAGGTMIDLGALWMAVDPPGDRPRTVRLNGAPSTVARRGWEGIAGAIGAVALPPAVVLVDTFEGLVAALGDAGAAQTVTALVAPGRTVVVVMDDAREVTRLGSIVDEHGVIVTVDGSDIVAVAPDTSLGAAPGAEPPPVVEVAPEPAPGPERRRRWWRRSSPGITADEPLEEPPVGAPPPLDTPVASGSGLAAPAPIVVTAVTVTDASGESVGHALLPGGYYLIRLQMKTPPEAPEPPGPGLGAWVEVGVIAEAVAVPVGPHAMFVPRRGAAWACPCQPGGPHTCLPEERSETLDLPFVAPRRPDVYRVHVAVRYRGSVVHQTRLELPVAIDGLGPMPTATVTYQLA